ncbi:CBS domain-containing protein [Rhizobiales bacterium]|uniref:CBS domain-containing protein n=1 Tax=Hongsoonwoonella zoysiae TaxID=2821844 RepID=UPI00155FE09A|nr:CBS domain-containing protein [Hongsoonwoonella zoysiae]NRG17704.1 CBS domain-containing protein [Hongsoonwoonella zoysiae]
MTQIRHLLESKGHEVWTIQPDDTVLHALEEMAAKDIGGLIVVDNGEYVGIFTERQYARNVFLKGRASPSTPIRDVMRTDRLFLRPEQTIQECMFVMSEKNVRHLPVLDHGKICGVVTIGDVLRSLVTDREFDIDQLVNYISGGR